MSGPAVRPSSARGSGARGGNNNPNYIRVVNPAWNGSPLMKRKDALHYVAQRRAVFVDDDHLRLTPHESNQKAEVRSLAAYALFVSPAERMNPVELRNIGIVAPTKAIKENLTLRKRVSN